MAADLPDRLPAGLLESFDGLLAGDISEPAH
jgi:hypothetical protein